MSKVPYQLLELSIISAQDLAPGSKNIRTYAVTWIKPENKFKTRIDPKGQNNPTWNDKFIFRIDDRFLNSDSSSVMIEIYSVGWLRDTLVGSVSVSISNLIPPSVRHERRFVALQIRRPSGRPQGILNVGVTLLDNTMRSMPLYTELTGSTVGFKEFFLEKQDKKREGNNNQEPSEGKIVKLLRSLSDQTDLTRKGAGKKKKNGSTCNGSSVHYYGHGSVVTGAGGGSVIDPFGSAVTGGGGGGSMLNGSICNSDVGPSPSVVAAAIALGLYPIQAGPPPKPGSAVLEDWKVEESSEEGFKSKIERWRHDQGYQRLDNNSRRGKKRGHRRRRTLGDGEDENDDGRFSCFGTAYGVEFTIVCGGNGKSGRKSRSKGQNSSKSSVTESNS